MARHGESTLLHETDGPSIILQVVRWTHQFLLGALHAVDGCIAAISPSPTSNSPQHLDEFIARCAHDVGSAVDDLLPVSGERLDPFALIESVAAENLTQVGIADHNGQSRLDQNGIGLIEKRSWPGHCCSPVRMEFFAHRPHHRHPGTGSGGSATRVPGSGPFRIGPGSAVRSSHVSARSRSRNTGCRLWNRATSSSPSASTITMV